MVTIPCKSDDTCMLCGSKDKVAEVVIERNDKKYRMVLCWVHVWDKVPLTAAAKKKPTKSENGKEEKPHVAPASKAG